MDSSSQAEASGYQGTIPNQFACTSLGASLVSWMQGLHPLCKLRRAPASSAGRLLSFGRAHFLITSSGLGIAGSLGWRTEPPSVVRYLQAITSRSGGGLRARAFEIGLFVRRWSWDQPGITRHHSSPCQVSGISSVRSALSRCSGARRVGLPERGQRGVLAPSFGQA